MAAFICAIIGIVYLLYAMFAPVDSPRVRMLARQAKQHDKDLRARADHLADRKLLQLRALGHKVLPYDHVAMSREILEKLKARGNPFRTPGGALYG